MSLTSCFSSNEEMVGLEEGQMTTGRWVGIALAACLFGASAPAVGSAQPLSLPVSPPRDASSPAEPAPDALYSVMAAVATGVTFPAREVVCGVGEIVGFFTLAVLRLPVWAVTLGDRYGSSEPLNRVGTAIVEKACEGPWVITEQQVKEMANPREREP